MKKLGKCCKMDKDNNSFCRMPWWKKCQNFNGKKDDVNKNKEKLESKKEEKKRSSGKLCKRCVPWWKKMLSLTREAIKTENYMLKRIQLMAQSREQKIRSLDGVKIKRKRIEKQELKKKKPGVCVKKNT
ncbi:MAG: hypothetical protein ACL7AX_07915 [Candidatus Arsenophonus phytopathogenicus]